MERILLIGGNSDYGRALVIALAEQQAEAEPVQLHVTVHGSPESWETLAHRGVQVGSITQLDLTADNIRRVIAATFAQHGPFNTVILAAAILGEKQQELMQSPKRIRTLFLTNVTGTSEVLVGVTNELVLQKHGQLLMCSSIAAARIRPDNAFYGITKQVAGEIIDTLRPRATEAGAQLRVLHLGYMYSKMTQGQPRAPFALTVRRAAAKTAKQLSGTRNNIWVPRQLQIVAYILKLMPSRLLTRLTRRK